MVEQERRLKIEIAFYEKKMYEAKSSGNNDKADEYQVEVAKLKDSLYQFIAGLEKTYPAYHRLKYDLSVATIEDAQNLLSKDQALLSYFTGDSSIYIFKILKYTFEAVSYTHLRAHET